MPTSIPSVGMPAALDRLRLRIDACLAATIAEVQHDGPERNHPLISRVYRWLQHYLDCGGKRMHGVAVLLAYHACGGTDEDAVLPVAAALQLYHHHTLVHDDIYDEDRSRRGWPTAHQAFADWFSRQEAVAGGERRIFVDGAMRRGTVVAFAYGKVCRALAGHLIVSSRFPAEARTDVTKALDWHDLFDNAAQLKDVYHEGDAMPEPRACLDNAWLKTGRLFEICAYAGARLAGASVARQRALETWAGHVAVAYQLQDDLEDLAVDSEKGQGRGIATDLLHCKPTYLYALAKTLAGAADQELLLRWQAGAKVGLTTADIIAILERSGAIEVCRAEVQHRIERALDALTSAQPPLDTMSWPLLREFANYFVSSSYWRRPLVNDESRAWTLLD